ncbi:hypothetical protein ScPMuIL_004392 [Solemya velum]
MKDVPIRMSSRNTLKRQSAIILNDYLCQTWFEHSQAKRRKTDNLISNGNDDIVVCKCENVKEETGEVNMTTDNVGDGNCFKFFHTTNLQTNGNIKSRRNIHQNDHADSELTKIGTGLKHDQDECKAVTDSTHLLKLFVVMIIIAQNLMTSFYCQQSELTKHGFGDISYNSTKYSFNDTSYNSIKYSFSDISYHTECKPHSKHKYDEIHGLYSLSRMIEHIPSETHENRLILCPASLNTFFEKIASTSSSAIDEIMIYEWNRFRSFVNFPRESPVYAIELSRAGFYYTGNFDEVVCFSCGARHSDWRSGDSPLGIHRHISPNCRFVNGNDTRNVRISDISSEGRRDSSQVSLLGNDDGTPSNGNRTVHNPTYTPTITPTHSGISTSNENGRNYGHYQGPRDSDGATDVFGIFSQRPKYPRYAVLAVRISSFENWPRYSGISPQSLAQAGLFYVGFGDNVRCFFCGGGMRNWEPQDVPWVEHARWFPRCPYVMQCQGSEFIQNVQQTADENVQQTADENVQQTSDEQNMPSAQVGPETNTKYSPRDSPTAYFSGPAGGATGHDEEADMLSSVAAQSAIEMGYTEVTVKDAVRLLREQKGMCEFDAEELVSLIMDNEEKEVQTNPYGLKEHDAEKSNPRQGNHSRGDGNSEKETDDGVASYIDDNIRSLMQENRQMREESLCRICLEESSCIVFLPCGHMVTCPRCAPAFKKCPVLSTGPRRPYLLDHRGRTHWRPHPLDNGNLIYWTTKVLSIGPRRLYPLDHGNLSTGPRRSYPLDHGNLIYWIAEALITGPRKLYILDHGGPIYWTTEILHWTTEVLSNGSRNSSNVYITLGM